jgi:hypothetical protein
VKGGKKQKQKDVVVVTRSDSPLQRQLNQERKGQQQNHENVSQSRNSKGSTSQTNAIKMEMG